MDDAHQYEQSTEAALNSDTHGFWLNMHEGTINWPILRHEPAPPIESGLQKSRSMSLSGIGGETNFREWQTLGGDSCPVKDDGRTIKQLAGEHFELLER